MKIKTFIISILLLFSLGWQYAGSFQMSWWNTEATELSKQYIVNNSVYNFIKRNPSCTDVNVKFVDEGKYAKVYVKCIEWGI